MKLASHENTLKYESSDIICIIRSIDIVSMIISQKLLSLIFIKKGASYNLSRREYYVEESYPVVFKQAINHAYILPPFPNIKTFEILHKAGKIK